MSITRYGLSLEEVDRFSEEMLTAALMYAASKIGKIDGDLASHLFSDDHVQKRFRDFLVAQIDVNYHTKNKVL